MTIKEIRALTTPELRRELEETRRELFNLRLRLATKQLANHREVPQVKGKIARILTILRERELEPTG